MSDVPKYYIINRYSIPDTPYSIPVNLDADALSDLINSLLVNNESGDKIQVLFDFLIAGIFVRSNIKEHIDHNSLSTVTLIIFIFIYSIFIHF